MQSTLSLQSLTYYRTCSIFIHPVPKLSAILSSTLFKGQDGRANLSNISTKTNAQEDGHKTFTTTVPVFHEWSHFPSTMSLSFFHSQHPPLVPWALNTTIPQYLGSDHHTAQPLCTIVASDSTPVTSVHYELTVSHGSYVSDGCFQPNAQSSDQTPASLGSAAPTGYNHGIYSNNV